jgi:hypothetical protein
VSADDYIFFEDCAVPDVRKTRIVSVRNRRSSGELGQIRWYGAWRQYCFFPQAGTIFNVDCMRRIEEECRAMMAAR